MLIKIVGDSVGFFTIVPIDLKQKNITASNKTAFIVQASIRVPIIVHVLI